MEEHLKNIDPNELASIIRTYFDKTYYNMKSKIVRMILNIKLMMKKIEDRR